MATDSSQDLSAAIAGTRLGLGARPGELSRIGRGPVEWALDQIEAGSEQPQPFGSAGALPGSHDRIAAFAKYQTLRRAAQQPGAGPSSEEAYKEQRRVILRGAEREYVARARLGATTERGFAERWVLFWANWFTVAGVKQDTVGLTGPFEREAIRPHVFGPFEDLLMAAERHPGMLIYLDQVRSAGPNSEAARLRASGLNENLAREAMELHTVGVDGGYTQADVTELARALTGWSATGQGTAAVGDASGFVFRPILHEPGARTVMGRRYPEGGVDQASAILRDLARHPSTGRHVARRVAAHFVADTPPSTLIDRLETAFNTSQGDLKTVARVLVESPEIWDPAPKKVKSPYEFIVSAYRAAGAQPGRTRQFAGIMTALGQQPFRAPSPEGWPDDGPSWASPDGLVRRLGFAQDFAGEQMPAQPPAERADEVLGARLGAVSRTAVQRAESRQEAFAVLLMSPEFQRR